MWSPSPCWSWCSSSGRPGSWASAWRSEPDPMMRDAGAGFAEVPWRAAIRIGLLGAVIAIFLCLVGIVPVFHARPLIKDVISLGQTALVLALLGTGVVAARTAGVRSRLAIVPGALAGSIAGAGLTALVLIGDLINVRA